LQGGIGDHLIINARGYLNYELYQRGLKDSLRKLFGARKLFVRYYS